MTEPRFTYIGPLEGETKRLPGRRASLAKRIPIPFLIVVVLPTLLAAIYFLLIAAPRYVSESQFVVRTPAKSQVSSLGVALEGVGLSTTSSDAYAVHEYIDSRDGLRELSKSVDIAKVYSQPGIDFFSRIPQPWQGSSFETLYKSFQRYLTVGYSASTGISTLRVEAFTPQDAKRINDALLAGGERLVNRMNQRSAVDTVADAERTVADAQERLANAQSAISTFRNRERYIDPASTAAAASKLVGELSISLARLRAERAQVATDAPNSPQLPSLDNGIRAFERQIQIEQAKIVGDATSLAPKLGEYERLALEQEFADKLLASATLALNSAQLEGRRQRLYIDPVVEANLPDKSEEPKRWLSILAVLATCLMIYGTGWLIWAGVRESRMD